MTVRRMAAPQKPWYLVIGPAGAGKSSILANSGFTFFDTPAIAPDLLAATGDLGRYWEAADAVFLECAGRLVGTTANDADEASWNALLKLLKRRHSPWPLNGAIVVAPLDALSSGLGSEIDIDGAMRGARKRVAEANMSLGAQLPVYVVVTKADLLPGFASYFGALTQTERGQVWGATLPLRADGDESSDAAERLAHALDGLREPLSRGLLASLHETGDPRSGAEIFAFPRTFATLTARLRTLLEMLGAASRPQAATRLRGLYLTAAPNFFLKRLFTEAILVEDVLVTIGSRDERRRLRQIGAALAAAVAVVLLVFLGFAFSDQSAFLATAQAKLADYARSAGDLPAQDVADADLVRAAQILAALNGETAATRFHLGAFSLDRSARVDAARRELATRALDGLVLPRVLVALQEKMRTTTAGTEARDAARLYLMLGGQSQLDPAFVERTLAGLYEPVAPPEARAALRAEATALLADPLAPIALDPIVMEDARALAQP